MSDISELKAAWDQYLAAWKTASEQEQQAFAQILKTLDEKEVVVVKQSLMALYDRPRQ